MRQFLKVLAHRLVGIPVVGWAVEIVAALYHLPKIRGQANAAWTRSLRDEARTAQLEARHLELDHHLARMAGAAQAMQSRAETDQARLAHLESGHRELCDRLAQAVHVVASPQLADDSRWADLEARQNALGDILTHLTQYAQADVESRVSELEIQHTAIAERLASVESTWSTHLPQLLNVIASGNHHLRALTRRVHFLESKLAAQTDPATAAALPPTTSGIDPQYDDMNERDDLVAGPAMELRRLECAIADRIAAGEALLTTLRAELTRADGDRSEVSWARAQLIDLKKSNTALESMIAQIAERVGYLDGRMEFVRSETLYEMKYGRAAATDQLPAAIRPKVVNHAKLAAARTNGIKLNLGCGQAPLEGHINIDRRDLPGIDVVSDVADLPFQAGELAAIHSSHLLEHFPQEQLRRQLLPYWRRLLKRGGTFTAVVPDADAMIRKYSEQEFPYEHLREVTFGGQDYDGDFHFNMLTPESLAAFLVEAGFTDPRVVASARPNGKCYEFEIVARNGG